MLPRNERVQGVEVTAASREHERRAPGRVPRINARPAFLRLKQYYAWTKGAGRSCGVVPTG